MKIRHAGEGVRLNLGCGDKYLPGFINIDQGPRRGQEPDIASDLRRLPLDDAYADEALAVHVIEHFYLWEVQAVLAEWIRVLKPGGRLVLECPNLMKAVFHFLANPQDPSLSMWAFYGDPGWQDEAMCHRWGYTPQTLAAEMKKAGLVNIREEAAQFKKPALRDMRLVGEKPDGEQT